MDKNVYSASSGPPPDLVAFPLALVAPRTALEHTLLHSTLTKECRDV